MTSNGKQTIFYISPSIIPSRLANSIHVVNMCEGLANYNYKVTLFSVTTLKSKKKAFLSLTKNYGIDNLDVKFISFKLKIKRGVEFFIAFSTFFVYFKCLIQNKKPDFIISRNLYGALIFVLIFRERVIYETHTLETGFRRVIQRYITNNKSIINVVISSALASILSNNYKMPIDKFHVLHDAAKSDLYRIDKLERRKIQINQLELVANLFSYDKVIGYFGHLYPGRGIDIIEGLASKNPSHIFLVYGGNEEDILHYKSNNTNDNLFFMGHINPEMVHRLMSMMDILLMPYQTSVSIGLKDVDTSKWMSPMKMFEYMSCGVPIISSNLSVLKEVLIDGYNSLLVKPDNVDDWSSAIQRISESPILEEKLGINAYKDYKEKYTWNIRAKSMIMLFDDF